MSIVSRIEMYNCIYIQMTITNMNFSFMNTHFGPTWDLNPGCQIFQASVQSIAKMKSSTKSLIKKKTYSGEGRTLNRLKKM